MVAILIALGKDAAFIREEAGQLDKIFLSLLLIGEAALLSTMGTTPGKWFFNIRLTDEQGQKINIRNSVKRNLFLWLFGFALLLPVVSVVTFCLSYKRLKNKGKTYWDERFGVTVIHGEFPRFRWIIFFLASVLWLFLVYVVLF